MDANCELPLALRNVSETPQLIVIFQVFGVLTITVIISGYIATATDSRDPMLIYVPVRECCMTPECASHQLRNLCKLPRLTVCYTAGRADIARFIQSTSVPHAN